MGEYIISGKAMERVAARLLSWAADGVADTPQNFWHIMEVLQEELRGSIVEIPSAENVLKQVEVDRCPICLRLIPKEPTSVAYSDGHKTEVWERELPEVDYPISYCKGH